VRYPTKTLKTTAASVISGGLHGRPQHEMKEAWHGTLVGSVSDRPDDFRWDQSPIPTTSTTLSASAPKNSCRTVGNRRLTNADYPVYLEEVASDDGKTRALIESWMGPAAVVTLGFTCLLILRPFISAALWAAILCFTTWPLFTRLEAIFGGRRMLAAAFATLLLSGIIIGPVAILVSRLSANVTEIIEASRKLVHEGPPAPPAWLASLPLVGTRLAARWSLLSMSSAERVAEGLKWLPAMKDVLLGSGRALGEGVFQVALSLLMVLFFYRDGEAAATRLTASINRIAGVRGNRLLLIAGATIRAVVYGVLGTALLQGVLAGAGFLIAGVPGASLLGFLTFLVAVIPGGPILVGAAPAVWLYHRGSIRKAIFIAVWIMVVGNLDSIVRPFLITRGSNTPLILIVLGVLGGAMAFGLIGLFLGPTLLAVGYSIFDEWSANRVID
jgi:predicted PurR-regulated permease PerM